LYIDEGFITTDDGIKYIICKKCAGGLTKDKRVRYTEENWKKGIKTLFSKEEKKQKVDNEIKRDEEHKVDNKNEDNDIKNDDNDIKNDEYDIKRKLNRKERRLFEREVQNRNLKGYEPSLVAGIEDETLKEKVYELQLSLPVEVLTKEDDTLDVIVKREKSKKKIKTKEKTKEKVDITGLFDIKLSKRGKR